MLRFLLIFTVLWGFWARGSSGAGLCAASLEAFRGDVVELATARAKGYATSTYTGYEYEFIHQEGLRATDHVLYLASGAGIYRAMMNFPGAGHYHFFDNLTGWGKTPAEFLREFRRRIHGLPRASVELRELGFTSLLAEADLARPWDSEVVNQIVSDHRGNRRFAKPLVYEVTFQFPNAGPQKKFFYLHRGDLSKDADLALIGQSLGKGERLFGTMQTGIMGAPSQNALRGFIEWGDGAGVVYLDTFTQDRPEIYSLTGGYQKFLGPGYDVIAHPTMIMDGYRYPYSTWVEIRESPSSR